MTAFDKQVSGTFRLDNGREVFGMLVLDGEYSELKLFDSVSFAHHSEPYFNVKGVLHDGRKVSIMQGVMLRTGTVMGRDIAANHYIEIFPHFVCVGGFQVSSDEEDIEEIAFVVEDASVIFSDFDAFSTVISPDNLIPHLKAAVSSKRNVEFGNHPIVAYFTGKFLISSVETVYGNFRLEHRPSSSFGDANGVRIENHVFAILTPPKPIKFREAIGQLRVLLRFFSLIAGREQALDKLSLTQTGDSENRLSTEVYRSFAPPIEEKESQENRKPHVVDVLVSTREGWKEQFNSVLKNYLELEPERHDGRSRLGNAFEKKRVYSMNRLVAAANMFDILPDSIYSRPKELDEDLLVAKTKARELFRALPDSLERSSILGALGRIGTLSLKHKIGQRATSSGLDARFPGIVSVLEEAVNCRNHYVHGSPGKLDYEKNFEIVWFFTDALEFVFGVSDMIDLGWDFQAWMSGSFGSSHPFSSFVTNYTPQFEYFKRLFDKD